MKFFCIICVVLLVAMPRAATFAQPPSPKLSERFNSALTRSLENGGPNSAQRTAGFHEFMKAQRQLLLARKQSTPIESFRLRGAGKASLVAALEKDPTLAEAYTMLAELELTSALQNVSEALAFTELAVRANPENFGGHRLQARILTRTSRITEPAFDRNIGLKAISAWKQVVRLDPQNAEGWAFLSKLYEVTGEPEQHIESLRKWTSTPTPFEVGFYRAVMGRESDLTPEYASIQLAAALINRDKADEAVDILTRILIDDPENKSALDLAAKAVDNEPKASLEKIAGKLRLALSSNPGNAALVMLVKKIDSSRM